MLSHKTEYNCSYKQKYSPKNHKQEMLKKLIYDPSPNIEKCILHMNRSNLLHNATQI